MTETQSRTAASVDLYDCEIQVSGANNLLSPLLLFFFLHVSRIYSNSAILGWKDEHCGRKVVLTGFSADGRQSECDDGGRMRDEVVHRNFLHFVLYDLHN